MRFVLLCALFFMSSIALGAAAQPKARQAPQVITLEGPAEPVGTFLVNAPGRQTFEGDVSWQAVGTQMDLGLWKAGVLIDGTGGKATGWLAKTFVIANPMQEVLTGEFDVKLAAFTTGIDLRDKHMRDKYLETAKFPNAHLSIVGAKAGEWSGTLQLKGQTKPVHGVYTLAADGTATAEFTVSLADFSNIGVPSYLGVSVAKDVAVKVSGKAK